MDEFAWIILKVIVWISAGGFALALIAGSAYLVAKYGYLGYLEGRSSYLNKTERKAKETHEHISRKKGRT